MGDVVGGECACLSTCCAELCVLMTTMYTHSLQVVLWQVCNTVGFLLCVLETQLGHNKCSRQN